MAHRAAADEICVKRGMGNPRQAAGGESSESPPAVFWLQETLLANQIEPYLFSVFFSQITVSRMLLCRERGAYPNAAAAALLSNRPLESRTATA